MRTKRTGWVAAIAALAALLAGCGSSGIPGAGELRAAPAAEAVPTDPELKGTAAGTEAFGLDLYRTMGGQRNMVLSPPDWPRRWEWRCRVRVAPRRGR